MISAFHFSNHSEPIRNVTTKMNGEQKGKNNTLHFRVGVPIGSAPTKPRHQKVSQVSKYYENKFNHSSKLPCGLYKLIIG